MNLYEYKNLVVLKNCVNSSFASSVEDNIEKAREKAGMIFSFDFNHRETNSLICTKFWRQACLPLLFNAELFTLNASQLIRSELCQPWLLKNIFYVPNFAPTSFLLKLCGLNSIE